MTRAIEVKIGLLVEDDRCQMRVDQNVEHAKTIAAAYDDGADVPALSAFELADGSLVVVDGFHRLWALRKREAKTARVVVVGKGTIEDARAAALGANATHGLNRTPADKRRAVRFALGHPYASEWSHEDIAEQCRVSVDLVRDVRAEMDEASATQAARLAAAERAAAVARARPGASSREVARAAGTSRKAASTAIAAGKLVAPGSEPARGPSLSVDARSALLASYDSWRRSGPVAAALRALGEAEASQLTAAMRVLRGSIRGGLSVPCARCDGTGEPRANPVGPATAGRTDCVWCSGSGEARRNDAAARPS